MQWENTMTNREIDTIIHQTEEKSNIYFDCFDTLVYRKYSSKYVFYRLAEFLLQEWSLKIPFDYILKGLQAFFVECDISFDEIAKNVFLHYIAGDSTEERLFVSQFKRAFIEAEMDNIKLAPNVLQLLDLLNAKKKKIFILSDFYLGKKELKLLLGSLLDVELFEDVIVSSDLGKTKYEGSLYECIVNPADSIMIGDNEISDYKRAIDHNLDAIRLDSRKQYLKYNKYAWNYGKKQRRQLVGYREKTGKYFCANYAYELYAFCKKLYSRLQLGDTVLFLARDGLFMKECFDSYLEETNKKKITTEYFEVSRLALLILVWDFEGKTAADFAKAFCHRSDWKINSADQLMHCLGFTEKEVSAYIASNGDASIDYFDTTDFVNLYNNERFKEEVKQKQQIALKKFLREITNNSTRNRIVTVDMGWKGTSQNDMRKILPEQLELQGFYFGTTVSVGELYNSTKEGLIFDYRDGIEIYDDSFHELEAMLKTDKGQLVCYTETGNAYIQDNGVRVYNIYSKNCQKKAIAVFRNLKSLDRVHPISTDMLISVAKVIKSKQSIRSLVWGRFYFDLQGNNDLDRTSPYFKDYKFAMKMYLYRKYPGLYFIKRRYKN